MIVRNKMQVLKKRSNRKQPWTLTLLFSASCILWNTAWSAGRPVQTARKAPARQVPSSLGGRRQLAQGKTLPRLATTFPDDGCNDDYSSPFYKIDGIISGNIHGDGDVGDNVYWPEGQSKQQTMEIGQTAVYTIRFEDETSGEMCGSYAPHYILVRGFAGSPGWQVRYYTLEGQDITQAVTVSGWYTSAISGVSESALVLKVTPLDVPNRSVLAVPVVGRIFPGNIPDHPSSPTPSPTPDLNFFYGQGVNMYQQDVVVAATTCSRPQVDAMIRAGASSAADESLQGYSINDFYTNYGDHQMVTQAGNVWSPPIFTVKVQNDSLHSDGIKITGMSGGNGWSVRYFDPAGGEDVTSEVTGQGWIVGYLWPGESRNLWVKIVIGKLAVGVDPYALVKATSMEDSNASDTVKAVIGTASVSQRIGGLEYSLDRVTWHPVAVDADIASLTVLEGQSYGLRVVRANPNEPWPTDVNANPFQGSTFPRLRPVWDVDGNPKVGEEIWVKYDQIRQGDEDFRIVTAECFDVLTVKIKVVRNYNISVTSSVEKLLTGGGMSDSAQSTLVATLTHWNGEPAVGYNVRFSVLGGAPVGRVNGSGTEDDVVTTDDLGKAQATLTSDSFSGPVSVAAILLSPGGQQLKQSPRISISFASPTPTPEPTLGPVPAGVTLNSGSPVTDSIVPLSWTEYQGSHFDRYEVHRSESADFSPSPGTMVKSFSTSTHVQCLDDHLEASTTYYYKLVVRDTLGQTTFSNQVQVTTSETE